MVEIEIANRTQHTAQIKDIFWEYLQWANERIFAEYQVSFDIQSMLIQDMLDLDKFMPPSGRLILGFVDGQTAGIACLKDLDGKIGEVKRMYVRPEYRRIGLGRALVDRLLVEAGQIGYQQVRLDSARFMEQAHQLYRTTGFRDIEAYEGSEIPKDFQKNWVFMEISLPRPAELQKPQVQKAAS